MISIAALTACRPQRSDIPGDYQATYPFGVETLVLRENGSYKQEFRLQGSSDVVTLSGHWSYDADDGQLQLENALPIVDGFGRLEKDYATARDGLRGLLVQRTPNGIRLAINEDLDLYFKRTAGS